MKRSDKTALAVGAVGTWIYIGGVDSDLWGRAALGVGMFLLALAGKFQSTLPRGERREGFNIRSRHQIFQSTLPRGERLTGQVSFHCRYGISIHAPARGATDVRPEYNFHLDELEG